MADADTPPPRWVWAVVFCNPPSAIRHPPSMTGDVGDGKIFVMPVERVIRIRTD